MQNVDLQVTKYLIGPFDGEEALSFQHIVEMRLGNSGLPRQPAFGSRAAAHALAKEVEQSLLQIEECHGLG